MRQALHVVARTGSGVFLLLLLTFNLSATPHQVRGSGPRERENPIVKAIAKAIRSLGDGLIIPTPPPKP